MTAVAKSRYQRYLREKAEAEERYVARLKALTPAQKKAILVEAGVLTKRGTFTAHYRTINPKAVTKKRA